MLENQDLIGYDEIIENSMRGVIYETLKKVENGGLPGKHYFVISFLTNYPEVQISQTLKDRYKDEMTIVVQYQYKSLKVTDDYFEISLSFAGKYERLMVPYKAVTSFADPSMNFGLKFSVSEESLEPGAKLALVDEDGHANRNSESDQDEDEEESDADSGAEDESGKKPKTKTKAKTSSKAKKKASKIDISEKVVSLDAFRKEKNNDNENK